MFKHETNTFSPIPTMYADFGPDNGPIFGQAAYDAFRHSGYSMAGLLAAAEDAKAEVATPIAARALPSRAVDDDAFDRIIAHICDAVRENCDALLLDMHGAMVVDSYFDGEGEALRRIRQAAPNLPIALALDFHGSITPEMAANANVIVGYQTFPHLDMVETGYKAGELLLDSLKTGKKLAIACARAPLISSVLRQVTGEEPMAGLLRMARQAESPEIPSISVFGGFPLSDAPQTGLSVAAVTSGDLRRAETICKEICDAAFAQKQNFIAELEPLQSAVARAKQLEEGPILLVDTADNCHSGGGQDCMGVIEQALACGLDNILAGPICDPIAAQRLFDAGVGARMTLQVGGRSSFGAIGAQNTPLELTGVVSAVSDGKFTVSAPLFTGMSVDLGNSVVFDTGPMRLVISQSRFEAMDFAMYRIFGLDETSAKYIIIKSKIQYRPTFGTIAKHIIECHGTGPASLDASRFPYKHLIRPIYPLDA
jgi:microcystin degradation protein MlrC